MLRALRRYMTYRPTLPKIGRRFLVRSSSTRLIQDVNTKEGENTITVKWTDNTCNRFPFVYLRDNCQCPICFNPDPRNRESDILIACDLTYTDTQFSLPNGTDQLRITWSDGHQSTFDADWLHKRRLPGEKALKSILPEDVETWGSEQTEKIPWMSFDEILSDDRALYRWIEALQIYGLVIIKDVPQQLGQLTRLGKHAAGCIHSTLFGKTFELIDRPENIGVAYRNQSLLLHLDLAYFDSTPDVFLLHFLKQAPKGGHSLFIDGFNVALKLQEMDPKAFDFLTKISLLHIDEGIHSNGRHLVRSHKTPIRLDHQGKLRQITCSEHSRGTKLDMTVKETQEFYEAYAKFIKLIRDPRNIVEIKMKAGEMYTLNNRRVFHGRRAFDLGINGKRWAEGGYVDWDALNSRKRILLQDWGQTIEDFQAV